MRLFIVILVWSFAHEITSMARADDKTNMPSMQMPSSSPPSTSSPTPSSSPPPPDEKPMEGMSMDSMDMSGMSMDHMMKGQAGSYAMMRDASGTAWQPDSTPMEGWNGTLGDWSIM